MTNEAELRLQIENAVPFTCADATGIEKGALLTLSDLRTVATCAANSAMIAGIAAREKVASDGRTELAVYRRGWFDMVASGAISVGQPVCSAAGTALFTNTVRAALVTSSGAVVLGTALETATDTERILIDLNIGAAGGVA